MTTGSPAPRPNDYDISPLSSWDAPSAVTAPDAPTPSGADAEPAARTPFAGTAVHRLSTAEAPPGRAALPEEPPARPAPAERLPIERSPDERSSAEREFFDRYGNGRAYGDPVVELVRAAVADQPLDEVIDLIMMLERSPDHAEALTDALRAVGVNRSVEDVTRLVALLTRPPRRPDCADEVIRAAVACRPMEDVSRLMKLLSRTSLEPHCGREAVRVAVTGRPVEDLVELIGRLTVERRARTERPDEDLPPLYDEDVAPAAAHDGPGTGERPAGPTAAPTAPDRPVRERHRTPRYGRIRRDRAPRPSGAGLPSWPDRLVAVVLAVCGVAFFPLHSGGVSVHAYGLALGLSALCLAVALLLTLRPAVPVLAAAVVVPAGLAAVKLYTHAFPSGRPARAMDLTLASIWVAVPVAVCAFLVALAALGPRVMTQARAGRGPVRPPARARRTTAD
ncbi:hypothetical protein SUDANB6_00269 [Streptomyces sp. enrichment culture]|uniref:hypothetical protein n=1 Tax=Streptomyces sp. enrichment culture TaxID=1795815 RepID=UPI003F55828B